MNKKFLKLGLNPQIETTLKFLHIYSIDNNKTKSDELVNYIV